MMQYEQRLIIDGLLSVRMGIVKNSMPDSRVLSYNGSELCYDDIDAFFSFGFRKDLIYVKTGQVARGMGLHGVPETQILTPSGYKNLGDIKVGDALLRYPNSQKLRKDGIIVKPEEAQVIEAIPSPMLWATKRHYVLGIRLKKSEAVVVSTGLVIKGD